MDATRYGIDYSPLERPVSRSEVRAFRTRSKASGVSHVSSTATVSLLAMMVFAVIAIGPLGAIFSTIWGNMGAETLGFGVMFLLVVSLLMFAMLRTVFLFGNRWEKWMRLTGFAEANGMQYTSSSPSPWYTGVIFCQGRSRAAYDSIKRTAGRLLEIGGYRYTTGSGKNRTTHNWGFMALALDRRSPT